MSKKTEKKDKKGNSKKIVAVALALIIFVSVSAVIYFSDENNSSSGNLTQQQKDNSSSKTAAEYDKEASKMLEPLAIEMAKDVSPYKFILPGVQKVEELTWNALDIDSTFTPSWERLGYIYAQIHGKQSVLRYKSYLKQDKQDLVAEEKESILLNFAKANLYYDKALEFGCSDSANIYYQKAAAASLQMLQYYVAENMLKAHEVEPQNRKYEVKLIEAYMQLGDFDKALERNEIYMKKYPESDIPYLNLGGYHYFIGDTATAMGYYQQAADMGSKPEVGKILHKYYMDHGYPDRAEYYLQKAYEAHSTYDPEKY